ncbi:MAG: GSCFA domain-containing protein [Rikenellaceae bacterium]|nr:GSCFA domain-containing protein [Rikenellaceae bacterium]
MEFRTKTDISKFDFKLDYSDKIFLIGSCFAENIGKRMSCLKFPVTVNPFGIVYNPLSVINTLRLLAYKKEFTEEDVRERNGLWYSFSHHGSFSSPDKKEVIDRINTSLTTGSSALTDSNYLVITLGTSWIYRLSETGSVVNNCHKLPSIYFTRQRLSVDDIVDGFTELFSNDLYRDKKIIFTVSPVRHIKDGITANSISKATLIVAANSLAEKLDNVYYFPSYEIVMDELIDYRFYSADMLHPSDVAVDYIWKNFKTALFSEPTIKISEKIEKINKAAAHRPLFPDSVQYAKFTEKFRSEINRIKTLYPFMDFSGEEKIFGSLE